jgi:hypothetical protein
MQKKIVYLEIGELTILFATLEHRLQQFLEMLIGQDEAMIGPLFIHSLNLVSLLRKIRMAAPSKLNQNQKLLTDLENTIKRVDETRSDRNLLIHGDWQIEQTDTYPIKVRDFKMRYEDGSWQQYSETTFTEKKVTQLIRRLKGLVNEVGYLTRELRQATQIPHQTVSEKIA